MIEIPGKLKSACSQGGVPEAANPVPTGRACVGRQRCWGAMLDARAGELEGSKEMA